MKKIERTPVKRIPLDPKHYHACGIFWVSLYKDGVKQGRWTHALGDDHADQIMRGEITEEDARRNADSVASQLMELALGGLKGI